EAWVTRGEYAILALHCAIKRGGEHTPSPLAGNLPGTAICSLDCPPQPRAEVDCNGRSRAPSWSTARREIDSTPQGVMDEVIQTFDEIELDCQQRRYGLFRAHFKLPHWLGGRSPSRRPSGVRVRGARKCNIL